MAKYNVTSHTTTGLSLVFESVKSKVDMNKKIADVQARTHSTPLIVRFNRKPYIHWANSTQLCDKANNISDFASERIFIVGSKLEAELLRAEINKDLLGGKIGKIRFCKSCGLGESDIS